MSYVKIWVHAVWCTKNRNRILLKDSKDQIIQHIRQNAKEKGIYIDSINGDLDHLHCLLALNADMPIAKVIQLLKGEAAYWVNKNSILKTKLEWADEYFAVSVSQSAVNRVRDYIRNQEAHHKKMSFKDEYDDFLTKFGFDNHG